MYIISLIYSNAILVFIVMIGIVLTSFFVGKDLIAKITSLFLVYILISILMLHLIAEQQIEDIFFPVFSSIFITFLLQLITGISIYKIYVEKTEEAEDW